MYFSWEQPNLIIEGDEGWRQQKGGTGLKHQQGSATVCESWAQFLISFFLRRCMIAYKLFIK